MQHLSTERLVARDWGVADAPSAFAIYGREEVARWLGAPAPAPRLLAGGDAQRDGSPDRG